jgi:hypothetical protein
MAWGEVLVAELLTFHVTMGGEEWAYQVLVVDSSVTPVAGKEQSLEGYLSIFVNSRQLMVFVCPAALGQVRSWLFPVPTGGNLQTLCMFTRWSKSEDL